MAIKLTRSANLERYRDLDLNFTAHPVTGNLTVLSEEDAIKRSVKHLVLLNFYDIAFKPTIGSDVNNLLFENATDFTKSNIEDAVRNVLESYEPRVDVDEVVANIDQDAHTAEITVVFFIVSQPEPITTTLIVKRNR